MKNTISFTVASRRIKYLGISLIKDVKDPYSENYTTLKKLNRTQINERIYYAPELEGLIPLKCPY